MKPQVRLSLINKNNTVVFCNAVSKRKAIERVMDLERQIDEIQTQYHNRLCRNCLFRHHTYYVNNIANVTDSEASDEEDNDIDINTSPNI
jgi:hypothetical protein